MAVMEDDFTDIKLNITTSLPSKDKGIKVSHEKKDPKEQTVKIKVKQKLNRPSQSDFKVNQTEEEKRVKFHKDEKSQFHKDEKSQFHKDEKSQFHKDEKSQFHKDEKSHSAQNNTDLSKGIISSLFGKNPEIPNFASRAVKPVSEPVFSTQLFKDLPLHPFTISNLDQNLGLQTLTTVQQKAIPVLLSGGDALIRSQTGSGKTLAYGLPIIEELQKIRPKIQRNEGIRAVILVPTRELALQTYEWFVKLVKPFTWIVPGYLVGGEKRKSEKARLRKGINILIGTPGRLLDHTQHTKSLHLGNVDWLVLDEADRLLDMGYEKDVAAIVETLNTQLNGRSHRTALLSATLTNAVERLAGLALNSPTYVDAAGDSMEEDLVIPESLEQFYILTPPKLRLVTLSAVVRWKCQKNKMIIFLATQDMVDFHTELLVFGIHGIQIFKLHGNMTQSERTQVFKTFRDAESGVLLSTDVAARGLDLPRVDCIVQYTGPTSTGDYVHRVGRTARVGTSGEAILFLTPPEVQFLRQLEDRRIRLREETMDRCLQKLKEMSRSKSVEQASTSLQLRYEEAVLNDSHLHDLASKAFVSWARFYASFPRHAREAFNFKSVHLGHYAKSFALRDSPSKIGGIGRRLHFDQSQQQRPKKHDRSGFQSKPKPDFLTSGKREVSEYSSGLEPLRKKKKKAL